MTDVMMLGSRLKQAREALEISLTDAAQRAGFANYQSLLAIESEERQVKAYELAKLAKIYHKDLNYFLDESIKCEPTIAWRDKKDSPATKEKEAEFLKYCNNYFILEQKAGGTKYDPLPACRDITNDFSDIDAIKLADEYRKDLNLGARPAVSLASILEEKHGIKIIFMDLSGCGTAASVKGDFGPGIVLNNTTVPWRRNYDLGHELFHIITWDYFIQKGHEDERIEHWANMFASCLLLPEDTVRAEVANKIQDGQLQLIDCIELARYFFVSTQALLWRLVNLNILKSKEVKELIQSEEVSKLDRNIREQDKDNPELLSSRYIHLAFKCHQLNLLSRGKLAEYLSVARGDVKDFLERHGYNEGETGHAFKITTAPGC